MAHSKGNKTAEIVGNIADVAAVAIPNPAVRLAAGITSAAAHGISGGDNVNGDPVTSGTPPANGKTRLR